jgi:hypothetical protein
MAGMGSSPRRPIGALAVVMMAAMLAGCGAGDPVVTESVAADDAAIATPGVANIAEELVRATLQATGLRQPVEVLDIREGQLDELRGLTPEAQASASLAPFQTGRRSLDRRAWRVTLIGTDVSNGCSGDPCIAPRVYVEAFLDPVSRTVFAVVIRPAPSPAPVLD